jgi:hypothetical protein
LWKEAETKSGRGKQWPDVEIGCEADEPVEKGKVQSSLAKCSLRIAHMIVSARAFCTCLQKESVKLHLFMVTVVAGYMLEHCRKSCPGGCGASAPSGPSALALVRDAWLEQDMGLGLGGYTALKVRRG